MALEGASRGEEKAYWPGFLRGDAREILGRMLESDPLRLRERSAVRLRERWYGLGRTERAIGRLHGDGLSARQRLRAALRLARFQLRAARAGRRSPDAAFRWELEALRLRGLLFGNVSAFEPVAPGGGPE